MILRLDPDAGPLLHLRKLIVAVGAYKIIRDFSTELAALGCGSRSELQREVEDLFSPVLGAYLAQELAVQERLAATEPPLPAGVSPDMAEDLTIRQLQLRARLQRYSAAHARCRVMLPKGAERALATMDLAEAASKEICSIVRGVIDQGQRRLEQRCKHFTAATPAEEVADALSLVLDNAQLAAISAATLASHLRDDAAASLVAHPPAVQGAMRVTKKHAEGLGRALSASLREASAVAAAAAERTLVSAQQKTDYTSGADSADGKPTPACARCGPSLSPLSLIVLCAMRARYTPLLEYASTPI